MSSHDSFAASGNSPTRKKKTAIPQGDFRIEFYGAIILLCPLTKPGRDWIEKNIARGSVQPYYHRGRVVVLETRYLAEVVAGIHRDRLVTR